MESETLKPVCIRIKKNRRRIYSDCGISKDSLSREQNMESTKSCLNSGEKKLQNKHVHFDLGTCLHIFLSTT